MARSAMDCPRPMRRGEVRLVDLDPVRGSEASKRRPAVLVSNDRANATAARLGGGGGPGRADPVGGRRAGRSRAGPGAAGSDERARRGTAGAPAVVSAMRVPRQAPR